MKKKDFLPAEYKIFKLYEELKETLKYQTLNNLKIASLLYQLHSNDNYKKLGYETFAEFCFSGVRWSKRKCEYYIHTFEKLCVLLKIPIKELEAIEMTCLREIASHITDKNKNELLEMAKTLTADEIRTELKLKEMSITERMACSHDYQYWVGRICQKCKIKEYKKINTSLYYYFGKKEKREFGKKELNEMIDYFKKKMELKKLDESEKMSRKYAQLIFNRLDRNIKEFKEIVDYASEEDKFYKNETTSMRFLFNHLFKLQKKKNEKLVVDKEREEEYKKTKKMLEERGKKGQG